MLTVAEKLQKKIKANHVFVIHTTRKDRFGQPYVIDIPESQLTHYISDGWKIAKLEAKAPVEAVKAEDVSVHQKLTDQNEIHSDQQKNKAAVQSRYAGSKKRDGRRPDDQRKV